MNENQRTETSGMASALICLLLAAAPGIHPNWANSMGFTRYSYGILKKTPI